MDSVLKLAAPLIGLALVWLVGSFLSRGIRALAERRRPDPLLEMLPGMGRGLPIYSLGGIDPAVSRICELAVAQKKFQRRARTPDGNDVVSIVTPTATFLALLGLNQLTEIGSAILIKAVYPVGPAGIDASVRNLMAAYGPSRF